jgi:ABC-type nitrate/sulfonate/bicarbonate transport system permease component
MDLNARVRALLTKTVSVVWTWRHLIISIISLAAFIEIWALYSAWLRGDPPFEFRHWVVTAEYIPYPWTVFHAFVGSFTVPDPFSGLYMTDHIYASLKRISIAFFLSFVTAVPLGLLLGRSRTAESISNPLVEMFRPIPPLAWVPIFLVIFKFFWGPILIVFLGIFFPLLLNVRLGARSVDPMLVDASKTLGASRSQIFGKVIFPYSVPYMMTGIKVGLGIGWMCIVAAEMLGAVGGGVGYYIFATAGVSRYDLMYAGLVTIGLLSVLTTGVAGLVERRMYRWMGME